MTDDCDFCNGKGTQRVPISPSKSMDLSCWNCKGTGKKIHQTETECVICEKVYLKNKLKLVKFKHWLIPLHHRLKYICKKCFKELKEDWQYDDERFLIQMEEIKK